ncbi:MAG: hypothetical protein AAF487_04615 [Bacteroidota bacterium]
MKNTMKSLFKTSSCIFLMLFSFEHFSAQTGNWIWGGNDCIAGVQTLTYEPANNDDVIAISAQSGNNVNVKSTDNPMTIELTPEQDFPYGSSVALQIEMLLNDGSSNTSIQYINVDQDCGLMINPSAVCREESINLDLVPKSGVSYSDVAWQLPFGWDILSATNGNKDLDIYLQENAVSGMIKASFQTSNGDMHEVNVPLFKLNDNSPDLFNLFGPTLICSPGTNLLYTTDDHPNATNYSWELFSGGSLVNGWSSAQPNLTLPSLSLGNYQLFVKAQGECGFGDPASIDIVVVQDIGQSSVDYAEVDVPHALWSNYSVNTVPEVFFNPCEYSDECFQRTIDKARLYLTVDFGNTFTFHGNAFELNLSGTIGSYSDINATSPANSFDFDIILNDFEPEAKVLVAFDTEMSNFVKHTLDNVVLTTNVDPEEDLRISLAYEIDWKDNVQSSTALVQNVGANINPTTKEVHFDWTNLCPIDFKNYEIQVLRLFNKPGYQFPSTLEGYIYDENADVFHLDWSKALSIETYSGATSIDLNIVEGPGHYVWRVRPIGDYFEGGIGNDRNWGMWSNNIQDGEISGAPSGVDYFEIQEQLDEDINWIYSRVFVEGNIEEQDEVKIGQQMSFANGLNQSILSQSLSNTFGVVSQHGIYDYSGRQSVSTLPVPTGQYHLGFNPDHIMNNASSERYGPEDFDQCTNYNDPAIAGMSGSFAYYDGLGNNNNDFVPSAEGYPFSRTLFYSDGERVQEQGGVGATMRLKPLESKSTKSYFGTPSQDELDRIFGEEAPIANSVQKIINEDPNGVMSGSYLSKDGKTLATFLMDNGKNQTVTGHSSANASYQNAINSASQTMIGLEDKDSSFLTTTTPNNHQEVPDNGIQVTSVITVPFDETITFEYDLNPAQIQEICDYNGIAFCYECDYRVNFSLIALDGPDCGDQVNNLFNSNDPDFPNNTVEPKLNSQSTEFNGDQGWIINAQNYTTQDCSSGAPATVEIRFEGVLLEAGSYQVSQTIYTNITAPGDNQTLWDIALSDIMGQYSTEISTVLQTAAGGWLNGVELNDGTFVFQSNDAYDDWLNNLHDDVTIIYETVVEGQSEYNPLGPKEFVSQVIGFEITLLENTSENCYESIFVPYYPCGDEPCPIDNFSTYDFVQNWVDYWNNIYATDEASQNTTPNLTPLDFPYPSGYDQATFNTLIHNMEAELGLYACSDLVQCWEAARDVFYPGLTVDSQTQFGITSSAEPDIVDFFISCAGYNYIGFTDQGGNISGAAINPQSTSPSYLTHAYAYVHLSMPDCNSSEQNILECISAQDFVNFNDGSTIFDFWGWTNAPSGSLVSIPSFCNGTIVGNSMVAEWSTLGFASDWPTGVTQSPQDLSNYLYTNLASCLNAQASGSNLTTDQIDYFENNFYGDLELECFDVCDAYFDAFVEELVEQHHQQGIYVEGYSMHYLIPVFVDQTLADQYPFTINYIDFGNTNIPQGLETNLQGLYDNWLVNANAGDYYWAPNYNWEWDGTWTGPFGSISYEEIQCMAMALVANCRDACDLDFVNEAGIGNPTIDNNNTPDDYSDDSILPADLAELEAMQEVMTAGGFEFYLNNSNTSCSDPEYNFQEVVSDGSTGMFNNLIPSPLELTDILNKALNDYIVYIKTGLEIGNFDFEYNGWNGVNWSWNGELANLTGCEISMTLNLTSDVTYSGSYNNGDPDGCIGFNKPLDCLLNENNLNEWGIYVGHLFIAGKEYFYFTPAEADYYGRPSIQDMLNENDLESSGMDYGGFTESYFEFFVNESGNVDIDLNYNFGCIYQPLSSPSVWCLFDKYMILEDHPEFQNHPDINNPNPVAWQDQFTTCLSNYQCQQNLCFRWINDPFIAPPLDDDEEINGPYNCEDANADMIQTEINAQIFDLLQNIETSYQNQYAQTCADPLTIDDQFSYDRILSDYHYTLYYYDRAGNLIQTVPPEGVLPQTYDGNTEEYYQGPTAHKMVTKYKYNNLGQLVFQTTPDGGNSYFWYDDLGRLRLSQNDQQRVDDQFSYSIYDNLGRLIEVGEYSDLDQNMTFTNLTETFDPVLHTTLTDEVENAISNPYWPLNYTNEVVKTDYSKAYNYAGFEQTFLQNRVSRTVNYGQAGNSEDDIRTYYSYDPHGNVDRLLQVIPGIGSKYLRYVYDLVSGNVLEVHYQEGEVDQLIHRYEYDADNRITSVLTSKDGVIWDRDAQYTYYRHGPLKRTQLGEDLVQGTDYTYTIHGWLKAINNVNMDVSSDLSQDGLVVKDFARDAFAMTLNYFTGDYSSASSPLDYTSQQASELYANSTDLFNGNISSWQNNMFVPNGQGSGTLVDGIDNHSANSYRYDELNRILTSEFRLAQGATGWQTGNDYASGYIYDRNGNILSLHRNAYAASGELIMDEMDYTYTEMDQFGHANNRLSQVQDHATTVSFDDIEDGVTNFIYDEIGNLISDIHAADQEGIQNIEWTVSGKIKSIDNLAATDSDLEFIYDATGNRVAKIEKPGGTTDVTQFVYTYYVRDAQGNTMATYSKRLEPCDVGDSFIGEISLDEQTIYGSSRLGIINRNEFVGTSYLGPICLEQAPDDFDFETGIIVIGDDPAEPSVAWIEKEMVNGEFVFSPVTNVISASSAKNHGVVTDENGVKLFTVQSFEGYEHEGQTYSELGLILDANETSMPSSAGMSIHNQSQIGALVIPETNYYLLFTVGTDGQPYYHIVDMDLNNGLGDIMLMQDGSLAKNLRFPTLPSNEYTPSLGVYCSDEYGRCWVVLRGKTNDPLVHSIDVIDIDTRVMAPTSVASSIVMNTEDGDDSPDMRATPDGRIMVIANNDQSGDLGVYSEVQMLMFDPFDRNNPFYLRKRSFIEAQGSISSFDFSSTAEKMVFVNYRAQDNMQFVYSYDFNTDEVKEYYGQSRALSEGNVKRWSDDKFYISGFDSFKLNSLEINPNDHVFAVVPVLDEAGDYKLSGPMPDGYAIKPDLNVISANLFQRDLKKKRYELSDHLGNVRSIITDRKLMSAEFGTDVLQPEVTAQNNYYPFGMLMPGRSIQDPDEYRYGFNGQEKDNEISGSGNSYTAEFWQYDSRLMKRWNTDPVVKHFESPYACFNGNPILRIDPRGDNAGDYYKKDGTYLGSDGKKDGKVYVATGTIKGKKGKEKFKDATELDITHSNFKKYAGIVKNEDPTNKESMFATASALSNYVAFKNANGNKTTYSSVINSGYSSASKSFSVNNKSKTKKQAIAAVINAMQGGHDYSNGATHWDGFDFAGNGLSHRKPVNQGVEISEEHLSDFQDAWPDQKISAFSGGTMTSFSSSLKPGIHLATSGNNAGRVLYKSSAVHGRTIFWAPNVDREYFTVEKQRIYNSDGTFSDDFKEEFHAPNEGYNWRFY